ncbi:hypothetical protein HanRHA438_Chr15g0692981 [Helianthus annuus]|nr:hypothetical protein HanRHA438_Chr15g0692981 [Helianthus annuus]
MPGTVATLTLRLFKITFKFPILSLDRPIRDTGTLDGILEATAVTVAVNHHHGRPVGDLAGFSMIAAPHSLSIAALSLSLTTKENEKWEANP